MKKKFGNIIFILSFISIVGIIILQISWLSNTFILQKQQYETEINSSLKEIKYKFFYASAMRYGYNPSSLNFENTTIQNLLLDQLTNIPEEEINEVISRRLSANGLKLDFEYAIIKNGLFLTNSLNFDLKSTQNTYEYILNNDNTIQLVLNIDFNKSTILKRSFWFIVASIVFTAILFYVFYLTNTTLIKLRQLTTTTNDYFNNMTHEFKTPLATISLAIDTLKTPKMQSMPDKQLFYLNTIKEENNRMHSLVQRILESARSESSELNVNMTSIHLHDILQATIDSMMLMVKEKNGTITADFNTHDDMVNGDEMHLMNIFNNLLDNALKYASPDRSPKIGIKTYNRNKNIVIEVSDNGLGMEKEALKYIFERFYRVSSGNLHNVKGYGLGLSYVKSVITLHRGVIRADSLLNRGSKFTIYLPLNQE